MRLSLRPSPLSCSHHIVIGRSSSGKVTAGFYSRSPSLASLSLTQSFSSHSGQTNVRHATTLLFSLFNVLTTSHPPSYPTTNHPSNSPSYPTSFPYSRPPCFLDFCDNPRMRSLHHSFLPFHFGAVATGFGVVFSFSLRLSVCILM